MMAIADSTNDDINGTVGSDHDDDNGDDNGSSDDVDDEYDRLDVDDGDGIGKNDDVDTYDSGNGTSSTTMMTMAAVSMPRARTTESSFLILLGFS